MSISKWASIKTVFFDLWKDEKEVEGETWIQISARILIFVICFFVFEKGLFRVTTIPFDKYYNDFIFWEVINDNYLAGGVILLLILSLIIFRSSLFQSWDDCGGRNIRIFVATTIALLAWQYSVYDYNFYFQNWHLWDRLLLIFLAFLAFWRPIFSVVFLFVLFPILGQFEVLPGFSLAVPLLLIRVIILYCVFLFLTVWTKMFRYKEFVFLVGCLIAAHYFSSGIRKLAFDWIVSDHLNYMLPNTYANGWLSFMSNEWITNVTGMLEFFNFPLKIFTLFVECGIVLFFLKEKLARIFLICVLAFHLGITFYTGIFFWKWVLVALLTLLLFFNKTSLEIRDLFGKKYFIISIALIAGGQFWCKPVPLTWADVPFTYTYKFKAIFDNGSTLDLPPNYFSPYDYQFTWSNFRFLNTEKRLQVAGGATSPANGPLYNSITSIDDLVKLEMLNGTIMHSPKSEDVLREIVLRFGENWNSENRLTNEYVDFIRPARLLLTYPKRTKGLTDAKIVSIEIYETTSLYTSATGYSEQRKLEVAKIQIPAKR